MLNGYQHNYQNVQMEHTKNNKEIENKKSFIPKIRLITLQSENTTAN